MKAKKVMPTMVLLGTIIVMVVLHLLFPGMTIIPTLWNLLGLIPLALGVWINLAADGAFHKVDSTVKCNLT